MTDYVLEISYDSSLDDDVQGRLFLTRSTGSSSIERHGRTVLTAYFDSASDRDAAKKVFADLDVLSEDRARLNWLERYEQSLEPIFIGRSFVIAPDLSLMPDDTRHRIVVPQEQAFGTGSHETTALCIEMLERIDLKGRRGLDIGSGSGILAMAMLRLGAEKVIAFDNDVDAYGAMRDNRVRNRIAESAMPLFLGSVEAMRGGTFDVITMNIVPEVIIPLLPRVIAHMRGALILSGILAERRDDVVAAASRLKLDGESAKGEWWCGRFSAL